MDNRTISDGEIKIRRELPENRRRLSYILLMCAAGIALNLIGSALAAALKLPCYLDTAGTVLAAALGGYLPGVIVGMGTNLINSASDSNQLYFGAVSMLVAVITAFLAHKGVFRRFPRVMLSVPAYVLTGGVLGSVIYFFMSGSDTGGTNPTLWDYLVSSLTSERFVSQLSADLRLELIDKSVTVLCVYLILRLLPVSARKLCMSLDPYYERPASKAHVPAEGMSAEEQLRLARGFLKGLPERARSLPSRITERLSGKRRTGITAAAAVSTPRSGSLRTKMMIMLLISALLISAGATLISYMLYKEYTVNEHVRMAEGVTSIVKAQIDPDLVDTYIEQGSDAVGYSRIKREMSVIMESHTDLQFLYVYKIMPDGCHVVFDVDSGDVKGLEPGEIQPFDETFIPYIDRLLAGEKIEPIVSDDYYGYLLTVYNPLYDSMGRCRCYVAADFSMNLLSFYGGVFMARLLAMFVGFFILILTAGLYFVERNIILPVNAMARSAGTFAYNSEEQRTRNVEVIRNLDIRTGDEIENLYRAFLKTTEDSMEYMENLRRAKVEVADMKEQVSIMDEIAHNDSLTGVRNKTAYDEDMVLLDGMIAGGDAEFRIIMIDVNYLKRTNDLYGHERGNIYLGNCCDMICDIFGKDNVYRVGGDEFVVILRDSSVKEGTRLVKRFKDGMARLAADKSLQPWEKVSAAVGTARYEKGRDNSAEEVFKRADKLMYEDKLAMKAQRTD